MFSTSKSRKGKYNGIAQYWGNITKIIIYIFLTIVLIFVAMFTTKFRL